MLRLQRHHRGAELDARRVAAISATMVSASKSSGTCGIHAVSRPASSAHSMSDTSFETLRAMSPRSAPIITPIALLPAFSVSARTSRTSTSSGVPVGKTAAAPADSSFGTSASGMVPPTTTAMSPASAARSASTVRGQRHVRPRIVSPTSATSSCSAIDTMSSMRCRMPV